MKFYETAELSADLKIALEKKQPFCATSIGDGECLFLLDIPYNQPDALNGILHNRSAKEKQLREKTLKMLPATDYIFAVDSLQEVIDKCNQPTNPVWMQHIYSYPKVIDLAGAHSSKLTDLMEKYGLPLSGHFFKALAGKKILFVGYYGEALNRLFADKRFREFYKIESEGVGFVPCSKKKSIDDVDVMVKKLKALKPFTDYDVALVGMGIPSNYVCLMIKQMGGIAIDIGECMSALCGDKNRPRRHFDKYLDIEL